MADSPSAAWTAAQRDAMDSWGESLLVSAAAGSGKTATLAERVARLVCNPEVACPVEEILVLTFTEAAAAEMRARIEGALAVRTESVFAQHQLLLLGRASISTFHGFCGKLLRRNFHLLGLDPTFRIADEQRAGLLRGEVIREVMEREHAGEHGEALRQFIEWYGNGDQDAIEGQVLRIDGLMASVVDPAGWRADAVGGLEEVVRDPEKSRLGEAFARRTREDLGARRERMELALSRLGTFPAYVKYGEEKLLPWIKQWIGEAGRGVWEMSAPPAKLPSLPGMPAGTEGKEAAAAVMDGLKKLVTRGPGVAGLPADPAYWRSSTAAALPYAKMLARLAESFSEAFAAAKRARNLLDFADLERLTLTLVLDESSGVAEMLRSQFRFVLVDECQDVNGVQNELIGRISRADNLFSVGDVKQSVYRFRLAEPELFERRREDYTLGRKPGRVITLAENFRSRAPLLAAINEVFDRLMVGGGTEICYREGHRLGAAPREAPASSFKGAPMEFHVLPPPPRGGSAATAGEAEEDGGDAGGSGPEDLESIEREAEFVAHRLRELVGTATVYDRELKVVRPARYGDVAVLMRVAQGRSALFAAQLRRRGIPVHADVRGGLLAAQEVRDVLALLELIDNPHRDFPLATYLRSPLALLTEPEETMARARLLAGEKAVFHEAIAIYAAEAEDDLASELRRALERVASWRTLAQRRPADELLDDVCEKTMYGAYVAGLADGPQRQANLEELLRLARAYAGGNPGCGGPGGVRAVCAGGGIVGGAEPDAPSVAGTRSDVVRVMTVHRSKGLEFPIVVLPDMGKRINTNDLNGSVLIAKGGTLAPKAYDPAKELLYPTPAWLLEREARRPRLIAEELRILYVALTRAREHVIMVATVDEKARESLAAWADHTGPIPESDILAATTPLPWIYAAGLTAHGEGRNPISFMEHEEAELMAWMAAGAAQHPGGIPQAVLDRVPLGGTSAEALAGAEARISRAMWRYLHRKAADRPAAVSVTSLTHTQAPVVVGQDEARAPVPSVTGTLELPRLAQQLAELSATDRGTVTHLALELLDHALTTDLEAQLEELVKRETLTARELAAVDLTALRWLLNSELGPYLRGERGKVHRELPVYLPGEEGEGLDRQMIRGRIDLLVDTPEGPIVIDYKTDRVSGKKLEERVEQYGKQVAFYRRAAEALTGKPCAGVYLAFISAEPRTVWKL